MKGPQQCRLCRGTEHNMYLESVYALGDQRFDLLRCRGCGLVFVNPMPDVETVRSMYSGDYFHSDFSCGMRVGSYLETEASRVKEYRAILAAIQEFKTRGSFLEVGCAAGSFLNYVNRAGFDATGVDISDWAVNTGREQFGLDIKQGRLVEIEIKDKSFDVIFLGDLLEHEPDPETFLRETYRILKDDGVIAIKVPTYVNSIYYRAFKLLPWIWSLGKLDRRLLQALKVSDDGPRFPPYHLYEYSPSTLELLCSNVGFKVLKTQSSLLVPEFLAQDPKSVAEQAALFGFRLLKFMVQTFNLRGGHMMVFAEKEMR